MRLCLELILLVGRYQYLRTTQAFVLENFATHNHYGCHLQANRNTEYLQAENELLHRQLKELWEELDQMRTKHTAELQSLREYFSTHNEPTSVSTILSQTFLATRSNL